MLNQVLTYWRTNWLPLMTGVVIAAIVVPVIKWLATHVYKATLKAGARAKSWVAVARLADVEEIPGQERQVRRPTVTWGPEMASRTYAGREASSAVPGRA